METKKILAKVGPNGKTIATPSICCKLLRQIRLMIQTYIYLATHENNPLLYHLYLSYY